MSAYKMQDHEYERQANSSMMTPAKLRKLSFTSMKRLAYEYNMMVPSDYTKHDIVDMFIDRMGEDAVAWTLLTNAVENL